MVLDVQVKETVSAESMDLAQLIDHSESVQTTETVETVYDWFQKAPQSKRFAPFGKTHGVKFIARLSPYPKQPKLDLFPARFQFDDWPLTIR